MGAVWVAWNIHNLSLIHQAATPELREADVVNRFAMKNIPKGHCAVFPQVWYITFSEKHWGLNKIVAICECIFFDAAGVFWPQWHWNLFTKVPSTIVSPWIVQVTIWRWTGDKQLSKPMTTYITDAHMRQSQFVTTIRPGRGYKCTIRSLSTLVINWSVDACD